MSRNVSAGFNYWLKGVRFYIACAILLISLEVWWWTSASYAGSVLFATRMEEVYAWLAVFLLGIAITIGPFYKVFPRFFLKPVMFDARRLLGIGAAWFATLHVGVAYVSLFKLTNPLSLPKIFQQAFTLGILALVILLAMAFTSFDRAFNSMGVWWFRLHRFVYAAALLSLLHAFIIGVHATHWLVLGILTAATVVILGLHVYISFFRHLKPTIWQILTISFLCLFLIAIFNYGYGQRLGYNPIVGKHTSYH